MAQSSFDLIVLGAGPGGYVAALRAAQLGLKVACVEKEKQLGGTCLRVGCIPSKALLESSERYREAREGLSSHGVEVDGVRLDLKAMMRRKTGIVDTLAKGIDGLLKKNRITRVEGHARFGAAGEVIVEGPKAQTLTAPNVIVATGSRVAPLKGVEVDGKAVGTSTEALSWSAVPKKLVVIGAGAIGLEMGSVWSRLGSKVVVVEYLDRVLPGMDAEIAAEAHKIFAHQGLEFRLGSRVTAAGKQGKGCVVECEGQEPLSCDKVLLAVGRIPNTEGLGLDAIGLETDPRGCIPVDEAYRTAREGVRAIGDVIAGPMLAHKAEEEGVACAEHIVRGYGHVHYDAIPNVVYTEPEVAGVGRTEEELKEAGTPYRKGSFPFLANGRARALGHTDGKVKVLAHAETDRILGVHIVGPRAGDLIAEAAVSIEFGASAEDVARASHAHPTLAEAIKEAAMGVDGRTLHL